MQSLRIYFFTLRLTVCIGLLFPLFYFTVTIVGEGICVTQFCGRLLLSLEMWRRCQAILWPVTAILENVEKISSNIVAGYCYP
jgi:threonine/homoserine efflux transporter RhtA